MDNTNCLPPKVAGKCGIVRYYLKGGEKVYNVGQACQDGWGVTWKEFYANHMNYAFQDRRNANHTVRIVKIRTFEGIFMVDFEGGDYLALDHAVEQFQLLTKQSA